MPSMLLLTSVVFSSIVVVLICEAGREWEWRSIAGGGREGVVINCCYRSTSPLVLCHLRRRRHACCRCCHSLPSLLSYSLCRYCSNLRSPTFFFMDAVKFYHECVCGAFSSCRIEVDDHAGLDTILVTRCVLEDVVDPLPESSGGYSVGGSILFSYEPRWLLLWISHIKLENNKLYNRIFKIFALKLEPLWSHMLPQFSLLLPFPSFRNNLCWLLIMHLYHLKMVSS